MNYPKSLFYNFLTVFFANHILPGIEVLSMTKLPHLGADIPFAVIVGLLNSLIYPVLKLIDHRVGVIRIALVAFIMNFAIYAILKVVPVGIQISSVEGYLIASFVISLSSFALNFFEMRSDRPHGGHHASHSHDEPKIPQ